MQPEINKTMGLREWAMLIILSILWGGSFFFIELAILELPPLTVVLLRVALAAIALWIFAFAKGLAVPTAPEVWWAFLVLGFINNALPFSLMSWGLIHITSSLASILNATTPLFTIIVAGVLLADERPTFLKVTGVAIGFAGTVIMIGPSALQGLGTDVLAQLAILGGTLSYAFGGVYGRRFKTLGVNPVIVAAGQVSASTLILVPVVLITEQPFSLPFPSLQGVTALLCLAILSTALAFILYFRILASAGATNVTLVTFLIPVSAIMLGTMVLGEELKPSHYGGMALIAMGLLTTDGKLWRFINNSRVMVLSKKTKGHL